MKEHIQGVTATPPGHSGSAPSPVPGLGHSASVPNAGRVIDYVNAADPAELVAEYLAHNQQDGWATEEAFAKFKRVLNSKIGIVAEDNMRVSLSLVPVSEWNEEEYIDVGGVDDTASNWALSFMPWGKWKLLLVEDATGRSLTISQAAAHIYYEITWHGWEADAEAKRDMLLDRMEEVERGLVETVPLFPASGIEVAEASETRSGSTEGESPVAESETP